MEYIIYELHVYDLTFVDFAQLVGNYYPQTTLVEKSKLGFSVLRKLLKSNLVVVQNLDSSDTVYESYEETKAILDEAEKQVYRRYPVDTAKFIFDSLFEIPYLASGNEKFTSIYEQMIIGSDWKDGVDEEDEGNTHMTFQQMMNYEHGKLDLYLGKSSLRRNK